MRHAARFFTLIGLLSSCILSGSLCRGLFCRRKCAAASAEDFFATGNARQPLPGNFSPQEMRGSLCRGLFCHRKRAAASAGDFFATGNVRQPLPENISERNRMGIFNLKF